MTKQEFDAYLQQAKQWVKDLTAWGKKKFKDGGDVSTQDDTSNPPVPPPPPPRNN